MRSRLGAEGEGIAHGVQQVHAVRGSEPVEAVDRWADRDRAGPHDEFVVLEPGPETVRVTDCDALAEGIDGAGGGVQA